MRKPILLAASLGIAMTAAPAHATGGMQCRTADGSDVTISMGFGHVPGAPVVASHLWANGRKIPVSASQWWLDDKEMRAVLTDDDGMRRLATLRTRANGYHYDGTLEWQGKRRWIRCRED